MSQPASTMQALRRVYIYGVAAATLIITAIAASNLLTVVIGQALESATSIPWVSGDADWIRERISLAVPMLIIAAPVWFFHWRMAQRTAHGPEAEHERSSLVRGAYLAATLLIPAFMALNAIITVLDVTVQSVLGTIGDDRSDLDSFVGQLSALIVVAVIWGFHVWTYQRDVARGAVAEPAALVPQATIHVIAALSVVILAFGVTDIIRIALDTLFDDIPLRGWKMPIASAIGQLVAGATLWVTHWQLARQTFHESDWWGRTVRQAQLRRGYVAAVLLIAGFVALWNVAGSIEHLTEAALRATPTRPRTSRVNEVIGPAVAAIPLGVFWLWHWRMLQREHMQPGTETEPVSMRRLGDYTMATLGLALGATGLAMMLSTIVDPESWRRDIGWPIGMLLTGGLTWFAATTAVRERLDRMLASEIASPIRRAWLFVVLGVSVIAAAVGTAITVYQVMQRVLEVDASADLMSAIATPFGVSVVAIGIAVWHGAMLQREMHQDGPETAAVSAPVTHVDLTLAGPSDADLETILTELRSHLPPGCRLEHQRQ